MKVHSYKSKSSGYYSNFRLHQSTIKKVEGHSKTFANHLKESDHYLLVIEEFYNALKEHKESGKGHPNQDTNKIFDQIISLIENFNRYYLKIARYDTKHHTQKHKKISKVRRNFQFNFKLIGVTVNHIGCLRVNTFYLKRILRDSTTAIDFIYEKNGFLDQLMNLYEEKIYQTSFHHIDKRI